MSGQSHNRRDDDLIRLKRIRQGLEEAPVEEHKEPPKLTGKAAAANFWVYHRVYFIIGALALAIVVGIVVTIVRNKRPDIVIAAQTGGTGFGAATEQLDEYFSNICGDTNGDGVKKAEIIDCSYNPDSDSGVSMAMQMKFQAQFGDNSAVLFVLDDDAVAKYADVSEGNLWVDDPNFKEYNGIALKLNGTAVEKKYKEITGSGFSKNIYLCVRQLSDKNAKSKRGKAALKAADKIVAEILGAK